MFRSDLNKHLVSQLSPQVSDLALLYGSEDRDTKFYSSLNEKLQPAAQLNAVVVREGLHPGDGARGNAGRLIWDPAWQGQAVALFDVYWCSQDDIRRLLERVPNVYITVRYFAGFAGGEAYSGEDANGAPCTHLEASWVRRPDGLISFRASPNEATYPAHPDMNWLWTGHGDRGLMECHRLRSVGPYTLFRVCRKVNPDSRVYVTAPPESVCGPFRPDFGSMSFGARTYWKIIMCLSAIPGMTTSLETLGLQVPSLAPVWKPVVRAEARQFSRVNRLAATNMERRVDVSLRDDLCFRSLAAGFPAEADVIQATTAACALFYGKTRAAKLLSQGHAVTQPSFEKLRAFTSEDPVKGFSVVPLLVVGVAALGTFMFARRGLRHAGFNVNPFQADSQAIDRLTVAAKSSWRSLTTQVASAAPDWGPAALLSDLTHTLSDAISWFGERVPLIPKVVDATQFGVKALCRSALKPVVDQAGVVSYEAFEPTVWNAARICTTIVLGATIEELWKRIPYGTATLAGYEMWHDAVRIELGVNRYYHVPMFFSRWPIHTTLASMPLLPAIACHSLLNVAIGTTVGAFALTRPDLLTPETGFGLLSSLWWFGAAVFGVKALSYFWPRPASDIAEHDELRIPQNHTGIHLLPKGFRFPAHVSKALGHARRSFHEISVTEDREPIRMSDLLDIPVQPDDGIYPVLWCWTGLMAKVARHPANVCVALAQRTYAIPACWTPDASEIHMRRWNALADLYCRVLPANLMEEYIPMTLPAWIETFTGYKRRKYESAVVDELSGIRMGKMAVMCKQDEILPFKELTVHMEKEEAQRLGVPFEGYPDPRFSDGVVVLLVDLKPRLIAIANPRKALYTGRYDQLLYKALSTFYAANEVFGHRWYWCGGKTAAQLDDIYARMRSHQPSFQTNGDDFRGIFEGLEYEADFSAADQTQKLPTRVFEHRVKEHLGYPKPNLEVAGEAFSDQARYYHRGKGLKIDVPRGGVKQHRATGSTGTSVDTTHSLGCALLEMRRTNVPFKDWPRELAYQFGLRLKILEPVSCGATFLRSLTLPCSDGMCHTVPLPSWCLKLGKFLTPPRRIASGLDVERKCLYALTKSIGYIPENYPILGPLVALFNRMGVYTATNVLVSKYEWTGHVDSTWTVCRETALLIFEERYGIDEGDCLRVRSLFDSMGADTPLPLVVTDPVFVRLAEVDYGAETLRA
jgi:hypothetical protein